MSRAQVLDHGYVELVESWGSDERIIEAARMSTGKGFQGWGPWCRQCRCNAWRASSPPEARVLSGEATRCPVCGANIEAGDEKLLRYLWTNKHATPFEMAGATLEVQAPIFVFREWHRHRTQSYNEMSARYAPLPDVNYVPTVERLMLNAGGTNKQAGTVVDAIPITVEGAETFRLYVQAVYDDAQHLYEQALAMGIPKELARIHLPVGRYSRMRASANLRNWLGFLSLRMEAGAQWEIRQFAKAVHDLLVPLYPLTLALFDERKP